MDIDWASPAAVIAGLAIIGATGLGLTISGSPYGTTLLTVHKLVAVALLAIIAVRALRTEPLPDSAPIWIAVAGVGFVALIASGGWISAVASPPQALLWVHRMAPLPAAAAAIVVSRVLLEAAT